jgi:ABC-type phosphate transport system substrate-binding protein
MNRLISGRARSGRRRVAILAAVICLVAAFGALNVSSAAALGEQCSGAKAQGIGAFLQTRAQQRWTGKESGFNGSSNPLACSGSQGSGGKPQVGYVPGHSTGALHIWGADDGVLHSKEFGFPINFLGTDIAPAGPVSEPGTMLANMKAALGSDLVVVPVTQTAIAIAAHPPQLPAHPACTVPKITPTQLQKVFSGEIKNWRQIGTASDSAVGGDCDQAITRIVRDESAGTTYQFKHFLDQVNSAPLACTGKEKRTWAQLQAPFGPPAETSPNQEWPNNGQCQAGEGKVTTVAGPGTEGENGPLSYVAKNPGTITYGSLPEAQQWAPEQVINVFNGIKYSGPESGEGEANCGAAKYTRPAGWEGGVNVDWSQVYGSDPTIGEAAKNAYSICTLSWDVAAANHFGKGVATTVHDYLAFVADKEGGQAAVRHIGYRDLPASIAKAATAAIAHINGEESEEEEGGEEEEEGGGTGTVLCKAEPFLSEGVLACPKGEGFTGIKVSGSLTGTATFKGAAGKSELVVLCPEGKYHGEFNEDGTSSGGGITELAFGLKEGCATNLPEEPEAIVSLENTPLDASSFQYVGAEAPQGAFTLAKSEGSPVLRIQSSITCIYLPLEVSGQVSNGSPTQLNLGGEWKLVESTSEECPSVLAFAAQFSVTQTVEGAPLYIAGKEGGEKEEEGEEEGGGGTGTVLCEAKPESVEGVLACPKGKGFTGEKITGTLLPEKVAVFESTSGPKLTVTCTDGRYGGSFNEDGTSIGGIYEFAFGLGEGCSTTFPEGPEAIVSLENTPFDVSAFKYTGAEGPNGFLSLAKSGGGVPLLRIQSSTTCVYAGELDLAVFDGSPSQLFMKSSWKLVEAESEACPLALTGYGPMTMTAYAEHLPLYIAGK